MDTFDAINQRRSAKAFDPSHRFTAAVGEAVKPAMPKGGQLTLSEVVIEDRFA
jgi:hypothetical protein